MTDARGRAESLQHDLDRWIRKVHEGENQSTYFWGAGVKAIAGFEELCRGVLKEHSVAFCDRATFGQLLDSMRQLDKEIGLDHGRRAFGGKRGGHLDRLSRLRNQHAHGGLEPLEVLDLLQILTTIMEWMTGTTAQAGASATHRR